MSVFGYCRISTHKQKMERQVRNILAYDPSAKIYEETFTGTKFQGRSVYDKMINKTNQGDTIIFDSVSRMSRNAEDGIKQYMELYDKGINLVFLKEHHIDTDTYKQAINNSISVNLESGDDSTDELMVDIIKGINKYIVRLAKKQIEIAFNQSEKEVTDLHARTREGMLTARLNGKRIGQEKGAKLVTKKSIEAKKKIEKYSKTFNGSLNNEDTWKLIGIDRMTFYKYKKELLEEIERK